MTTVSIAIISSTLLSVFLFLHCMLEIKSLRTKLEIKDIRVESLRFSVDLHDHLFLSQEESLEFQSMKSTMTILVLSGHMSKDILLVNALMSKHESFMSEYEKQPVPDFNAEKPDLEKARIEFKARINMIRDCKKDLIEITKKFNAERTGCVGASETNEIKLFNDQQEDNKKTYLN